MSATLAWGLLLVAGALEVVWAVGIRYTESWTRPIPSALVVVAYVACLPLLSVVMKAIPAGTAYAVWVGLGAAGIVLWGIVFFGESASPARLFCLALIVAGVVGLKLVE